VAVVVMNLQDRAVDIVLQDQVTNTSAVHLSIPAGSIQTYTYTAESTVLETIMM
jgi:hypothetical protein